MNSIKYKMVCQEMGTKNMLKFIICGLFLLLGFILYCCVRCGSEYDREVDDIEQEKFLENWK